MTLMGTFGAMRQIVQACHARDAVGVYLCVHDFHGWICHVHLNLKRVNLQHV